MFCKSYRATLNGAVLSGEPLPADAESHLAVCTSCRREFSVEKTLFGLIDAEVRTRVNAAAPASLLPRIRQQIAAAPAAGTGGMPVLAYVTTGLVIGAIVLSFAVRTKVFSVKPEHSARGAASPVANEPNASQRASRSGQMLLATRKRDQRPRQVAVKVMPEVLVANEEQLGLQRYAASLRNVMTDRAATMKSDAVLEIKPLEIAGMDLKGLSIDPLQSGDSD